MTLRIAYVTSGMGSVGTAICQKLARSGHTVVAGCGPNSPRKEAWLREQRELGFDFVASEGNAADWDSTVAAFAKVKAEVGEIDVLVNNAGGSRDTLFRQMTRDDWNAVIASNLHSLFNITKQVVDGMTSRGWGRVVNIGSVSAHKGQIGRSISLPPRRRCTDSVAPWRKKSPRAGSPSTPSRLAISPAPRSAAFHRMCSTAWPLRCQCAGSANPSKLPACVPGLLLMRLPMSTAPITRSMAGSTWLSCRHGCAVRHAVTPCAMHATSTQASGRTGLAQPTCVPTTARIAPQQLRRLSASARKRPPPREQPSSSAN